MLLDILNIILLAIAILTIPIMLLLLIILRIKRSKYLWSDKLKPRFKIAIGINVLSAALSILAVVLESQYVSHYQLVNNSCPSTSLYKVITLTLAFIGVLPLIYIMIVIFKQKDYVTGLLTIVFIILFILLAIAGLIFSTFCL